MRRLVYACLAYSDGSSVDLCGHHGTAEVFLNRISLNQTSGVVVGSRYSGDRVECVASRLGDFTHIVLRIRNGTLRLKSLSFHAYSWPVCGISHMLDNLADGRERKYRGKM